MLRLGVIPQAYALIGRSTFIPIELELLKNVHLFIDFGLVEEKKHFCLDCEKKNTFVWIVKKKTLLFEKSLLTRFLRVPVPKNGGQTISRSRNPKTYFRQV